MNKLKGIIFVSIASFCFGMMPVWAKQAYATGLEPIELVMLRTSVAGVILLAFLLLRKKNIVIEKAGRKSVLAVCGLYSAVMIAFFYGVQNLDSGVANSLFHLYPIFIMVIATIIYKAKLSLYSWIALAVTLLGLFVLAYHDFGGAKTWGVLLMIASSLAFALYSLALDNQHVRPVDPLVLTFYICILASIMTFIIWILTNTSTLVLSVSGFFYVLLLSIFSTIIGLVTYVKAVQILGPTSAGILSNAEIVVTFVAGSLILGEILSINTILGGALIIAACVIVSVFSTRDMPEVEQ